MDQAGGGVTIRELKGDPSEMAELQRVIEDAPTYAQLVTGAPPGRADAQSTYTVLPEGKSYEDKFVFGIYRYGSVISETILFEKTLDPPPP
jgi:hypothetical protein